MQQCNRFYIIFVVLVIYNFQITLLVLISQHLYVHTKWMRSHSQPPMPVCPVSCTWSWGRVRAAGTFCKRSNIIRKNVEQPNVLLLFCWCWNWCRGAVADHVGHSLIEQFKVTNGIMRIVFHFNGSCWNVIVACK